MKYLICKIVLVTAVVILNMPISLANFNVGRALPYQASQCEKILYTNSGEKVEGHPMLNVPKYILVVTSNSDEMVLNTVRFDYQGFGRSWDSLLTTYRDIQGRVLYLDDACYSNQSLLHCLHFQGCQYYFHL
jgi:hypothetical protein